MDVEPGAGVAVGFSVGVDVPPGVGVGVSDGVGVAVVADVGLGVGVGVSVISMISAGVGVGSPLMPRIASARAFSSSGSQPVSAQTLANNSSSATICESGNSGTSEPSTGTRSNSMLSRSLLLSL